MTVTFVVSPAPCFCGYVTRGVSVRTVRVNKGSLRTTDVGLAWLPRSCRECGAPPSRSGERLGYALRPDDAAKVHAYRRRKGWVTA